MLAAVLVLILVLILILVLVLVLAVVLLLVLILIVHFVRLRIYHSSGAGRVYSMPMDLRFIPGLKNQANKQSGCDRSGDSAGRCL